MNGPDLARLRWRCATLVGLASLALQSWRHFHGGVPVHHLLQRKELPGLSCWWDVPVLFLLTWLLVGRMGRRMGDTDAKGPVWMGFLLALSVGVLMSALFLSPYQAWLEYAIQVLLLLSLGWPIYRAECLLGYVLGMSTTFGAVLPLAFGSVIAGLGFLLHQGLRVGWRWARRLRERET